MVVLLGSLGHHLLVSLLGLGLGQPLHCRPIGSRVVVIGQLGAGGNRIFQVRDISQAEAGQLQQQNPGTG